MGKDRGGFAPTQQLRRIRGAGGTGGAAQVPTSGRGRWRGKGGGPAGRRRQWGCPGRYFSTVLGVLLKCN